MDNRQQLITEIERAAQDLNLSGSTIGKLAGQGGRFYARLKAGKRFWPETADKVRETIAALRQDRGEA